MDVLPTDDEQSVFADPVPCSWCQYPVLGLVGGAKKQQTLLMAAIPGANNFAPGKAF